MKNTKTLAAIRQAGRLAELWLPLKIGYDHIPGISVGIVHGGKLAYSGNFGFADVRKKMRPTSRTLYRIASHSKMFTAVAILKLVEEGKLRLDDTVASYLPWFAIRSGQKNASRITVRQLLSHIAGVFRDGKDPFWTTGDFPADLKAMADADSLSDHPLADFKYTNYGFAVLGALIEERTGVSYEEYMKKVILKPLGMSHTVPDYDGNDAHLAQGYGAVFPGVDLAKRHAFRHTRTRAFAPATGFISTVEDLSKFLSIFSTSSRGPKLLDQNSLREMMYPTADTGEGKYGFGLEIEDIDGHKTIGHGGGYAGYMTRTLYDPQADIGVIVLTNSVEASSYGIARALFEAVHAYIGEPQPSPAFLRCEGIYRNEWEDDAIIVKGKKLVVFEPQANNPLRSRLSLVPTKVPGEFTISTQNKFTSYGEKARFTDLKNGKYRRMNFAASCSVRIK